MSRRSASLAFRLQAVGEPAATDAWKRQFLILAAKVLRKSRITKFSPQKVSQIILWQSFSLPLPRRRTPRAAFADTTCRVCNLSVPRLQSQRAAFANVACRVCRHGAGLSKERRKVIDGTVQDFGHRPALHRPPEPENPLLSTLSAHRQGRGLPAPTNAPRLARVYNI